MENDKITHDIFKALDTKNRGFISKQHLIDQMAEYLSQTEVPCPEYALKKLNRTKKYPDLIDYETFKEFYHDLMEPKSPMNTKHLSLSEDDYTRDDSSTDSDIDDCNSESVFNLNLSRTTLQGSVVDLYDLPVNFNRQQLLNLPDRRRSIASFVPLQDAKTKSRPSFSSPANSLRRRTFENAAMNKSMSSAAPEDTKQFEDFDEISCMTDSGVSVAAEEVDRLVNSYKSLVMELSDVKQRLEDSNNRYQKQRDMTMLHNERIAMLEEQIRQFELSQSEELEIKKKELKVAVESLQRNRQKDYEEHKHNDNMFRQEILNRLNMIESEYTASKAEYEKMKNEYNILSKEKEKLKKELKISDKRCFDLEAALKSYKESVSIQIEELQRERDNAERINKELNDKLQDMRVTYRCQDSNNWSSAAPSTSNSPVQNRPMSWAGPFTFLSHSTSSSKNSLETAGGISSAPSCTTISQLEHIVHRLTMENRNLVEKVAHLETLEFYQRQRLHTSNNMSLADEMEHQNFSQLKNSLALEREIATRLHTYIISLTNRLMQAGYIEAFRHG